MTEIIVNYFYSFIQVSCNATVRYQTTTGERVLTYNYTSEQHWTNADIPLYNANSTYVLRVTAVTEDNRMFTSNDVMITEDELHGYISSGQSGKLITVNTLETRVILCVTFLDNMYFQIGLKLMGSQESFNCASFEV